MLTVMVHIRGLNIKIVIMTNSTIYAPFIAQVYAPTTQACLHPICSSFATYSHWVLTLFFILFPSFFWQFVLFYQDTEENGPWTALCLLAKPANQYSAVKQQRFPASDLWITSLHNKMGELLFPVNMYIVNTLASVVPSLTPFFFASNKSPVINIVPNLFGT